MEFLPPWDDAEPTATDMSFLLDPPAGKHGRVVVCGEHLCFEDGTRARFWGVNIVGVACCPEHEIAEKLAARLAKLGFNAIRFHGLDADWALGGLMSMNMSLKKRAEARLERFDYFVTKLAEKGIYTYLELHVWPDYLTRDVPDAENITAKGKDGWPAFPWAKTVSLFDRKMMQKQTQWYRTILTHVNPYRHFKYAQDPAVALVEIANENSLLAGWETAALDNLPPYYAKELDDLWNQWLAKRYGSPTAAASVWKARQPVVTTLPVSKGNLLRDDMWSLEVHGRAKASVSRGKSNTISNMSSAQTRNSLSQRPVMVPAESYNLSRSQVKRSIHADQALADGAEIIIQVPEKERWRVQYTNLGLVLQPSVWYSLIFEARTDDPRKIGVFLQENAAPWTLLGLRREVQLTQDWQEHRLTFLMPRSQHRGKLTFTLGDKPGMVQIRNVILVREPAPEVNFFEGVFVGRPRRNAELAYPNAMLVDYLTFLTDIERNYFLAMRNEIRNLGYSGPIVGTNSYGWLGSLVQAEVADVIDQHAYWDHPAFPRIKWSKTDWMISDRSMLNSPQDSTLVELAYSRIWGKPFIVSEYNHAYPNRYDVEAIPFIATYAAMQDWDGVFVFSYSSGDFERTKLDRFFDIDRHPGKLTVLPFAGAAFLRGDISPGTSHLRIPIEWTDALKLQLDSGVSVGQAARLYGLNLMAPSQQPVGLAITQVLNEKCVSATCKVGNSPASSSATGLKWEMGRGKHYLHVSAPRSAAIIGFISGTELATSGIHLKLGPTPQLFATAALIALDNKPLTSTSRLLVIVAGQTEPRWGSSPRLQVPSAKIELTRSIAHLKAYVLGPAGNRIRTISVYHNLDKWIMPLDESPWYEIEID